MYILKSEDSRFIFSFDHKLFEKPEDCINHEFNTLRKGSVLKCVYDPDDFGRRVLEHFHLTYQKKYIIRRLYSCPHSKKKNFIIKVDNGEIQNFTLITGLGKFFNVVSTEKEELVPQ